MVVSFLDKVRNSLHKIQNTLVQYMYKIYPLNFKIKFCISWRKYRNQRFVFLYEDIKRKNTSGFNSNFFLNYIYIYIYIQYVKIWCPIIFEYATINSFCKCIKNVKLCTKNMKIKIRTVMRWFTENINQNMKNVRDDWIL